MTFQLQKVEDAQQQCKAGVAMASQDLRAIVGDTHYFEETLDVRCATL